jgi:hypothetical protein
VNVAKQKPVDDVWEKERGSSVATLVEMLPTLRPWPPGDSSEEIRALCMVFARGWIAACRRACVYYLGSIGATRLELARLEKLLLFAEGQIEKIGSGRAFTGNWRRGRAVDAR